MLHCTSSCRSLYLPVSSASFVCRAHTQYRKVSKVGLQHLGKACVRQRARHRGVQSQRNTACASSLLDQAWGTHINAQELATNIFSTSIIPYSAFLYWLTKSKKTPPLALFGFYFLLVFVFATIPAGVIALKVYKKSLANVDFLHGSAESMLTVTNLLIVLGLRQGVKQAEAARSKQNANRGETRITNPADAAKQ